LIESERRQSFGKPSTVRIPKLSSRGILELNFNFLVKLFEEFFSRTFSWQNVMAHASLSV
jgi:hypothetical protein